MVVTSCVQRHTFIVTSNWGQMCLNLQMGVDFPLLVIHWVAHSKMSWKIPKTFLKTHKIPKTIAKVLKIIPKTFTNIQKIKKHDKNIKNQSKTLQHILFLVHTHRKRHTTIFWATQMMTTYQIHQPIKTSPHDHLYKDASFLTNKTW